jgi:hypothetical protein
MGTLLPRDRNNQLPELAQLMDAAWLCAHGFGALTTVTPMPEPAAPEPRHGAETVDRKSDAEKAAVSNPPEKSKPTAPSETEEVAEIKADAGKGHAKEANNRRIAIPAARAIAEGRSLVRALKPLRRRVSDPQRQSLDEARSVDHYAQTRLSVPMFTPARQRWLSVVLLIDDAPSMRIWTEVVSEFRALLIQLAGFADVRSWFLDAGASDKACVRLGKSCSAPTAEL